MATRSAYFELPRDFFDFVNDRVSSMSKNVDFPLVLQCFFKVSHSARKGNGPTNMQSGTRFERHLGGPCAQIVLLAAARSTFR